MRCWVHFFIIYVLIHGATGDRAVSYEGMSTGTITSLITEPFDFIGKPAYDAFNSAHQPVPATPEEILDSLRSAAVTQLNTDVSGNAKVLRAVLLVVLDEINILRERDVDRAADTEAATTFANLKTRWAARSILQDRTNIQLKNAIEAKINSGASD